MDDSTGLSSAELEPADGAPRPQPVGEGFLKRGKGKSESPESAGFIGVGAEDLRRAPAPAADTCGHPAT